MAKGSVRKKGKKWYYRFYVEDASGNSVQREFPGSESKSETEAMLRKAMADYEEKQFVAKSENLTLAGLLDKWIEEELKPGSLRNGTAPCGNTPLCCKVRSASRCSRSSTSPSIPCSTSCTARGRRTTTCFRRTVRRRIFPLSRRFPTNSFLN